MWSPGRGYLDGLVIWAVVLAWAAGEGMTGILAHSGGKQQLEQEGVGKGGRDHAGNIRVQAPGKSLLWQYCL